MCCDPTRPYTLGTTCQSSKDSKPDKGDPLMNLIKLIRNKNGVQASWDLLVPANFQIYKIKWSALLDPKSLEDQSINIILSNCLMNF